MYNFSSGVVKFFRLEMTNAAENEALSEQIILTNVENQESPRFQSNAIISQHNTDWDLYNNP